MSSPQMIRMLGLSATIPPQAPGRLGPVLTQPPWSRQRLTHPGWLLVGRAVATVDPLAVVVAELVPKRSVGTPFRYGWAAVVGVAALAVAVVLLVVELAVGKESADSGVAIGGI